MRKTIVRFAGMFAVNLFVISTVIAAGGFGNLQPSPHRDRFLTDEYRYRDMSLPNSFAAPNPNQPYGIVLYAPAIAENSAVVPVTAKVFGMDGVNLYLTEIRFYTCEMIQPIARFKFANKTTTRVSTRIKMRKSNTIIAVGKLNTGEYIVDRQWIRNAIGGCGGGGPASSEFDGVGADDNARGAPVATTWIRSTLPQNSVRMLINDYLAPVVNYRADIKIDGFRARVLLDISFKNETNWQREGVFQLRLPDNASPYYVAYGDTVIQDTLKQQVQLSQHVTRAIGFTAAELDFQRPRHTGTLKEGIMVPRKDASAAYFATTRRRIDPALVEWEGTGIFSIRVFPVQPYQTHRVLLGYDINLPTTGEGRLGYQFSKPENVPNATLVVHVNKQNLPQLIHATPAASTHSHTAAVRYHYALVNQDRVNFVFDKLHDVMMTGADTAGKYFALQFSPQLPEQLAEAGSPYAVLAVDTSLSSQPQSFNDYVNLAQRILSENSDSIHYFAVMLFDIGTHWWQPAFVPNTEQNRNALRDYLYTQTLTGATDLTRAIMEISSPQQLISDDIPQWDVFLLSDGQHNWGSSDMQQMLRHLQNSRVRQMHAYITRQQGIDRSMLQALTGATGGALYSVLPELGYLSTARAHRFQAWKLESIEIPGASDVLVADTIEHLYAGQLIYLTGRGQPDRGKFKLKLSRHGEQHTLEQSFGTRISSELTPRMHGENAVRYLEDNQPALHVTTLAYAGHFRIPRKSMSLLMLESQAEYDRYKIKTNIDYTTLVSKESIHDTSIASVRHVRKPVYGHATDIDDFDKFAFNMRTRCEAWAELVNRLEEVRQSPMHIHVTPMYYSQQARRDDLSEGISFYDIDAAYELTARQISKVSASENVRLRAMSALVELAPHDPLTLDRVAYFAMQHGFEYDAYYLLQKLLAIAPGHQTANRHLAQLLDKMHRADYAELIRRMQAESIYARK